MLELGNFVLQSVNFSLARSSLYLSRVLYICFRRSQTCDLATVKAQWAPAKRELISLCELFLWEGINSNFVGTALFWGLIFRMLHYAPRSIPGILMLQATQHAYMPSSDRRQTPTTRSCTIRTSGAPSWESPMYGCGPLSSVCMAFA